MVFREGGSAKLLGAGIVGHDGKSDCNAESGDEGGEGDGWIVMSWT